jgi:hypothetical protein
MPDKLLTLSLKKLVSNVITAKSIIANVYDMRVIVNSDIGLLSSLASFKDYLFSNNIDLIKFLDIIQKEFGLNLNSEIDITEQLSISILNSKYDMADIISNLDRISGLNKHETVNFNDEFLIRCIKTISDSPQIVDTIELSAGIFTDSTIEILASLSLLLLIQKQDVVSYLDNLLININLSKNDLISLLEIVSADLSKNKSEEISVLDINEKEFKTKRYDTAVTEDLLSKIPTKSLLDTVLNLDVKIIQFDKDLRDTVNTQELLCKVVSIKFSDIIDISDVARPYIGGYDDIRPEDINSIFDSNVLKIDKLLNDSIANTDHILKYQTKELLENIGLHEDFVLVFNKNNDDKIMLSDISQIGLDTDRFSIITLNENLQLLFNREISDNISLEDVLLSAIRKVSNDNCLASVYISKDVVQNINNYIDATDLLETVLLSPTKFHSSIVSSSDSIDAYVQDYFNDVYGGFDYCGKRLLIQYLNQFTDNSFISDVLNTLLKKYLVETVLYQDVLSSIFVKASSDTIYTNENINKSFATETIETILFETSLSNSIDKSVSDTVTTVDTLQLLRMYQSKLIADNVLTSELLVANIQDYFNSDYYVGSYCGTVRTL